MGILGLVIIFCHDLLFLIPSNQTAMANPSVINSILTSLYSMGAFPVFSGRVFIMGYPPVPWLGIMLVGLLCREIVRITCRQEKRNISENRHSGFVTFCSYPFYKYIWRPFAMVIPKKRIIYISVFYECYEVPSLALVLSSHAGYHVPDTCLFRTDEPICTDRIGLRESSPVLFSDTFIPDPFHHARDHVFARLPLVVSGLCFGNFWKTKGCRERCSIVGRLSDLDRCGSYII